MEKCLSFKLKEEKQLLQFLKKHSEGSPNKLKIKAIHELLLSYQSNRKPEKGTNINTLHQGQDETFLITISNCQALKQESM